MIGDLYAKLDQRIVYSSMWDEDGDTCKVWVTLLALKNINTGIVDKNITGIARLCKLPLSKVEEAFAKFQAPDPNSSSKAEEGRRIVPAERGWRIVNHLQYMELGWSEDKKKFERERKAKYRAGRGGITVPELEPEPEKPAAVATKKKDDAPDELDSFHDDAATIIELMNQLSGAKLRAVDSNLDPIVVRLKEDGVDLEGCAKMLRRQWELWKDDFTTDGKAMREFFKPSTIFQTRKFDGYYSARDLPITKPTKKNEQPPKILTGSKPNNGF